MEGHRMRRITLGEGSVNFYVGPAGVLVVAEFPLLAEAQARRLWEDSGRTIPALPVVLKPELKEPQGRVDGMLALRDEGAIMDYLRGNRLLDNDEVDLVAAWLRNRNLPVPPIRPKEGRYRLRGEEVTERRTKVSPAFVAKLAPPGALPRPHLGQVVWRALGQWVQAVWGALGWPVKAIWRALGWRVVFLPELAMFLLLALDKRGVESLLPWSLVAALLLRFRASFGGNPLGWKRLTLLTVGGVELAAVLVVISSAAAHPGMPASMWYWLATILVPGLISFLRGAWLFLRAPNRPRGRRPFRVRFPLRSSYPR